MIYNPRTSCPQTKNKYYNTKSNTGYSSCIEGNKTTGCYNSSINVLPNCVGYAAGRFNEIANQNKFVYNLNCNAEDFYNNAKKFNLKVGMVPKLGAIAVWSKGKVGVKADGTGHVAIVEKIISTTEIITSESGWSSTKLFWNQTRKKGTNGNWGQSTAYKFLGFVYHPAIDNSTLPILSRGDKGLHVKELQTQLNKCGCDISVDGLFGSETLTAVKNIQKRNKLVVDGIVGEKTYKPIKDSIKPAGVIDFKFNLGGKYATVWATIINNQKYIKLSDLEFFNIVPSQKE